MIKEFRLYDVYDGYKNKVLIGEFDTMQEVKRAALHWDIEETDGECCFALYRYDFSRRGYCLVEDWTY